MHHPEKASWQHGATPASMMDHCELLRCQWRRLARVLLIRSVVQPAVVRFRVHGIEKVDLHVLAYERMCRLGTIDVTRHLPRQRWWSPDGELQRYIFALARPCSFVSRVDARPLDNGSTIADGLERRRSHSLNASRARNLESRRSSLVKCIGSFARFLAIDNRSISQ